MRPATPRLPPTTAAASRPAADPRPEDSRAVDGAGGEPCPECRGRGWRVVPDGGAGRAVRCGCVQRDRHRQRLERSGIPEQYLRCRLSNFREHGQAADREAIRRARAVAENYLERFYDPEKQTFQRSGLLLIGPPGTGKTHLAVAILRGLIERYAVRGRFVDFTRLLYEIQSTFHADSPATRASLLDPVIQAEVLVLDELGAQKPTEWAMDNLYLIINSRYTAGRATLFTTNYQLAGGAATRAGQVVASASGRLEGGESEAGGRRKTLLASRLSASLVSRLYEMAQPVVISAADFRREVRQHQHRYGG